MTAWVVYCWAVAALVGLGAVAGERALRSRGWGGRWAWAGALGVSVLLPAWAWLGRGAVDSPVPALPIGYVVEHLPPLVAAEAGPEVAPWALALAAWAVVSSALLLGILLLLVRLDLARRRWPSRMVDGVEVLVSARTGPAALGIVRGRVVVPEWALSLAPGRRRLLLLHEAEHVRAGDPQLALGALLLCALLPWNLPLWWQLGRLRLALEMDCDARVLRRGADLRSYGTLLLEVGQRRARLALALAEPQSNLERRIRMMTANWTGPRAGRALAFTALSGLALAVACETPGPDGRSAEPTAVEEAGAAPRTWSDVAAEPTFTPMTQPPRITNLDEVKRALMRNYPPLLRDAGIGGTTNVWFLVDERGAVQRLQVNRGSGYEALDAAALRVAADAEFAPARNGDEPVPVWIALDLTFGVD